jgi:hypothetical protein
VEDPQAAPLWRYKASGKMPNSAKIHWGRVLAGGSFSDLLVFAVVFPVRHFFGERAFLGSILIASAVMPFLLALWAARGVESHFALHGGLVGFVATLIYLSLAWGQAQPLLYQVAHGLKIAGGIVGSRCKAAEG